MSEEKNASHLSQAIAGWINHSSLLSVHGSYFHLRIYHVVMSWRITGFQDFTFPLDSELPEARAFVSFFLITSLGTQSCPVCRRAQSMITQQINTLQALH